MWADIARSTVYMMCSDSVVDTLWAHEADDEDQCYGLMNGSMKNNGEETHWGYMELSCQFALHMVHKQEGSFVMNI